MPLTGDFDGDGKGDLVIYRANGGLWYAKTHDQHVIFRNLQWGGEASDVPLTGDFDGDGRDDLAIYRADEALWYAKTAENVVIFRQLAWGRPVIDRPLVGDFDGDGRDDVGIYRTVGGLWFAKSAANKVIFRNLQWGGAEGDTPLVGDLDGDGRDDLVIYRVSGGQASWWGTRADGDVLFRNVVIPGGEGVDNIPLVGDVNGDGRADLVSYDPESGAWRAIDWRETEWEREQFIVDGKQWGGVPGDVPLLISLRSRELSVNIEKPTPRRPSRPEDPVIPEDPEPDPEILWKVRCVCQDVTGWAVVDINTCAVAPEDGPHLSGLSLQCGLLRTKIESLTRLRTQCTLQSGSEEEVVGRICPVSPSAGYSEILCIGQNCE